MKRQNSLIRPWYREPMVWLLIAIPFMAAVMGTITFYLAVVSDDGLVADDYYRRGLAINRSLEKDRVAAINDLRAAVVMEKERGVVEVDLGARSGFQFPDQVEITFAHATQSGLDRALTLFRTAADSYRTDLPELSPGRWYVGLHTRDWRLHGTLSLPGQTKLTIQSDPSLKTRKSENG